MVNFVIKVVSIWIGKWNISLPVYTSIPFQGYVCVWERERERDLKSTYLISQNISCIFKILNIFNYFLFYLPRYQFQSKHPKNL